MSPDLRLAALLSKGWFPKELPPAFTTESFGKNASEILSDWKKTGVFETKPLKLRRGKKIKRNSYIYDLPHSDAELLSKPKRGHERRNIAITHPIPQAILSYEIAYNSKRLQRWLSKQQFSLDRIAISHEFERSVREINFDIHSVKKAFIKSTADWLVKTDINRFYPSIYTHSIAWAAYGKERVKGHLENYKGSLADRLDLLVRACNRNQTVGIPIGPETSRIIAEVISARIDYEFRAKVSDIAVRQIDRLQDDWFIGVDSLEMAEKTLSVISNVYRDFGLEINGSKTSVDRVISIAEDAWVSEIRAFLSHKSGPISGSRLKELLSLCLRMQVQFPRENVVGYVLSVIEGNYLMPSDVGILESFLLQAATSAPIALDRICRIMINTNHFFGNISRSRIESRFTTLAERCLSNGYIYEVIWLLYTLRGLRIKLNSRMISELMESSQHSSTVLILLDMEEKGLVAQKLPKVTWESSINAEAIHTSPTWLLAYEGIRRGWLVDRNSVMKTPFFSAMTSRDISFYDAKRNVPPSRKEAMLRNIRTRKAALEARRFLQYLRGFEDY